MREPNKSVTRVNINLNTDLVNKIDNFASENGINRTSAVSVIISTYFRQDEAIKAIEKATSLINQANA